MDHIDHTDQTQWSINNSCLGDVSVANWRYSQTIEELVYIYISYSYNPAGDVITPPNTYLDICLFRVKRQNHW